MSEGQISNNIHPQCIKWLWRKSDHKLMAIVWLIIRVDFESIKKNFFQIIYCSSRVTRWVAALLPRPLGLRPVNFIFNALFIDMVKIYLFEHGRKINELTFNVLASSLRWCSGNPGGRDPTAAIHRNKYYLRRWHGAKFQPRALSDKLHDVKITFSLYKQHWLSRSYPALKSNPVRRKWRLSHHLNSFTPSLSLPPGNK